MQKNFYKKRSAILYMFIYVCINIFTPKRLSNNQNIHWRHLQEWRNVIQMDAIFLILFVLCLKNLAETHQARNPLKNSEKKTFLHEFFNMNIKNGVNMLTMFWHFMNVPYLKIDYIFPFCWEFKLNLINSFNLMRLKWWKVWEYRLICSYIHSKEDLFYKGREEWDWHLYRIIVIFST